MQRNCEGLHVARSEYCAHGTARERNRRRQGGTRGSYRGEEPSMLG